MESLSLNFDNSWKKVLNQEFEKDYFKNIQSFLKEEVKTHTVFPNSNQIFSAFQLTHFDDVKVVIIGQDPYHGINQAHGLCFSVLKGVEHPPSLKNIFKELSNDLGYPYPQHGDLTSWAKQGVLLLNATLTVRKNEANSHQHIGWQQFTDIVIQKLSDERANLIFLLWGNFAKKKGRKIDTNKHIVLTSGHPSPLSANKGQWFGNKHFSKTNETLIKNGLQPINWQIL